MTAAEMTKLAVLKMYDWILENDLIHTVKIVNIVHDEAVLECPEHMGQEIADIMCKCMREAGNVFSTILMDADYDIGRNWGH
jgi:DNA polymerase I-like protein with 3'-5' exonuclease and polymerase domains